MKEKIFKPILASNDQVNLEDLKYPLLASYKLDGIRMIFYKGQILSRSLKQIQNNQLKEKFEKIRKYSEHCDYILDGEAYSPNLTFQEITSFVMTHDFTEKKSVKKFGKVMEIPEHLNFYAFDYLDDEECDTPFKDRLEYLFDIAVDLKETLVPVKHVLVNNPKEVEDLFEKALEGGCEGLILRDPNGRYKFGRSTTKEGIILKVKPYRSFDSRIIGVVQSTVVDPNAEKKVNELNRSVTSKKKGDRLLIEKASAFNVEYEGKKLKVVLAMTDMEKSEVWQNKESYIGKWIQYKGMLVGAKDVPRHPIMEKFREDLDES